MALCPFCISEKLYAVYYWKTFWPVICRHVNLLDTVDFSISHHFQWPWSLLRVTRSSEKNLRFVFVSFSVCFGSVIYWFIIKFDVFVVQSEHPKTTSQKELRETAGVLPACLRTVMNPFFLKAGIVINRTAFCFLIPIEMTVTPPLLIVTVAWNYGNLCTHFLGKFCGDETW